MMSKGKGIAQESEHDYPWKKHKSRQEGLDEDILNMLSEASRNEISFLKTQVMSFREREDDREREITELRDMDKSVLEVVDEGDKGDDDNDDEGDNDQVMVYLNGAGAGGVSFIGDVVVSGSGVGSSVVGERGDGGKTSGSDGGKVGDNDIGGSSAGGIGGELKESHYSDIDGSDYDDLDEKDVIFESSIGKPMNEKANGEIVEVDETLDDSSIDKS
ncbi:hypothetical protein L1987_24004 [Smallanthus sonchifolius]|uniref:Uncharacterized protein n=1 Tax=Smallanthus sonchifolius TaxID=185202 RepID=A0ACB9IK48_9ASTR|nr:hypothetical protein L1987_24004 [Smallanthus sonchifolius]